MAQPLIPPANDPPITRDGQHSPSWNAHFQDVAAAVARVGTGTTTNDNAAAGQVGEYLTASSAGPVGLTTNIVSNIASLPLTAGDWEVWGAITFVAAGTTHPTQIGASISQFSGALGDATQIIGATFNVGSTQSIGTAGAARISLPGPATVYLVSFATFTTAGMTATGTIKARRAR